MKSRFLKLVLLFSALVTFVASASAQQTVSQRLSEQLVASAAQQLDADLYLGQLNVNGLTDELNAENIRLATRVAALSEPLNQLIIADEVRLSGDWQSLGQRRVGIEKVWLSGVQLTVAYYGVGQSNLHTLLSELQQQVSYQPARLGQAIDWQLQELVFDDVTINLFDRGEPIASVHVPALTIDNLDSNRSSSDQVDRLIFPIIEQLLRQWRAGQSSDTQNIQIDGPALTRFLMREALAF